MCQALYIVFHIHRLYPPDNTIVPIQRRRIEKVGSRNWSLAGDACPLCMALGAQYPPPATYWWYTPGIAALEER